MTFILLGFIRFMNVKILLLTTISCSGCISTYPMPETTYDYYSRLSSLANKCMQIGKITPQLHAEYIISRSAALSTWDYNNNKLLNMTSGFKIELDENPFSENEFKSLCLSAESKIIQMNNQIAIRRSQAREINKQKVKIMNQLSQSANDFNNQSRQMLNSVRGMRVPPPTFGIPRNNKQLTWRNIPSY